MARTDQVKLVVLASRSRLWRAMTEPEALLAWLPPSGARGRFEHVDIRAGGAYRLVLTFADPAPGGAKSTQDEDVVDARVVELIGEERFVQAVEFVSEDPAFAGTMTMSWTLDDALGGTAVTFRADDVPPGISAADHEIGMRSSLEQLAAFVAPRAG